MENHNGHIGIILGTGIGKKIALLTPAEMGGDWCLVTIEGKSFSIKTLNPPLKSDSMDLEGLEKLISVEGLPSFFMNEGESEVLKKLMP